MGQFSHAAVSLSGFSVRLPWFRNRRLTKWDPLPAFVCVRSLGFPTETCRQVLGRNRPFKAAISADGDRLAIQEESVSQAPRNRLPPDDHRSGLDTQSRRGPLLPPQARYRQSDALLRSGQRSS